MSTNNPLFGINVRNLRMNRFSYDYSGVYVTRSA